MRVLWTILGILGTAYLSLALLLYFFQSRLLHLPDVPSRTLTMTPSQIGLAYQTVIIDTDDGLKLHGWFIPNQDARGVLLFFHGNAGNISHRLVSLELFHRLGFSTLIIDYRGYGQSQGEPSEPGLYRDAMAAFDYLHKVRKVSPRDMVYFGRSLGGAVAAWLAAQHPPAALVLESSFTSVPDMATELYPLLPVRLLCRIQYDTRAYLKTVHSPLLIIHSTEDEIIPFEHGRQLFNAANDPKQFLQISGDHNNGFLDDRETYEQGMDAFLDAHLRP